VEDASVKELNGAKGIILQVMLTIVVTVVLFRRVLFSTFNFPKAEIKGDPSW